MFEAAGETVNDIDRNEILRLSLIITNSHLEPANFELSTFNSKLSSYARTDAAAG